MVKTALISVSDKACVTEFAIGLSELGFEILSTGGTDLSIDGIPFRDQAPPEGGVLAETDVFAQVDENGAFSFAEALAAFQPADL